MEIYSTIVSSGAAALRSLNANLTDADEQGEVSSLPAYWFSSPEEVVQCMLIAVAVFAWPAVAMSRIVWPVDVRRAADYAASSTGAWRFLDVAQRVGLLVCFLATLAYKIPTGRGGFMLMPCHIQAACLLLLSILPERSAFANRLSFVAQVLNWGTILAMLAPDTRDHHLFLEPFFFWLYHALLLTLPLTWLARRRFNVYKGYRGLLLTWSVYSLIAQYPVQLASIVTGQNFTYMMLPPKPLKWAGPQYRKFFGLVVIPTMLLLTRYVLLEAVLLVAGARDAAKAEETAAIKAVEDEAASKATAAQQADAADSDESVSADGDNAGDASEADPDDDDADASADDNDDAQRTGDAAKLVDSVLGYAAQRARSSSPSAVRSPAAAATASTPLQSPAVRNTGSARKPSPSAKRAPTPPPPALVANVLAYAAARTSPSAAPAASPAGTQKRVRSGSVAGGSRAE